MEDRKQKQSYSQYYCCSSFHWSGCSLTYFQALLFLEFVYFDSWLGYFPHSILSFLMVFLIVFVMLWEVNTPFPLNFDAEINCLLILVKTMNSFLILALLQESLPSFLTQVVGSLNHLWQGPFRFKSVVYLLEDEVLQLSLAMNYFIF